MIWLPGILSQGGKKYAWNRYAIAYGEKAGTAATVSRTYNKSKYASTAYTIQNGVFVLTNPVATTFENLTSGKRTVDIADSTNTVSSGATLYKITSKGERVYEQSTGSGKNLNDFVNTSQALKMCTSLSFNNTTGQFTLKANKNVAPENWSGTYYSDKQDNLYIQNTSVTTSTVYKQVVTSNEYVYNEGYSSYGYQYAYTSYKITSAQSDTLSIGYTPYTISQSRGDLIDTVTDADPAAYPENGIQDGYWYVLQ